MKLIDNSSKTNWKFIAIVVVFVLLAVGGILLFVSLRSKSLGINPIVSIQCSKLEQEIDTLIKQAMYCEVDSDCVVPQGKLVPGNPPCSCLYAVNRNYTEFSELEDAVQSWNGSCSQGVVCEPCAPPSQFAKCEQNKCVGSVESVMDTSTWQTYRNDEFGFEVRYPESFLRKEFPARTNEGVFGVSLRDKKYQEGHYPTLNVVVIKTSLSPREWLEEYYDPAGPPILGDIPEPSTGYENVEEITINGVPALRFRLLAASDSSLSTIIQGKVGTLYHVQAISSGLGNFPRELHDQILSTFRFVE